MQLTLWFRYNVAGAAYDRGDVSDATRHYERVLFLSGKSLFSQALLLLCFDVCHVYTVRQQKHTPAAWVRQRLGSSQKTNPKIRI
jgi:hypothetical protein